MRTILLVVYLSPKFTDLRPQIPNFLRLADGASFIIGNMLIYAFRWVAMSTASMAGFDSITLAARSTLAYG